MLQNFNPVNFSNQENEWLLKHLGEPPVIAMKDIHPELNPKAHPKDSNPYIYPDGVVPAAVRPVIEGVYELMELEKAEGLQWAGIEAIKNAIRVWLRENAKWSKDAKFKRGAPRFPSLYSFDGKGRPHIAGPGSDSGVVKTYFGPAGERIPFEIELMPEYKGEWAAPTTVSEQSSSAELFIDATTNRIECRVKTPDGICGHTESYKPGSRASFNAARARMSKHLRKATVEVEAHRELHTNEFTS